MGQKTPSPSLRINLNRQYDLCWFKEDKYYSDLFLKDFQCRQHFQKVCEQLPNSIYFGRILSSLYPKKYNLHIFSCFQENTNKPKSGLESAQKSTKVINKNQIFQDFLSQKLRQSQFSSCKSEKPELTIASASVNTNVNTKLVDLENVSQKFTRCHTNIQIVKTPHFNSSAHFFNEILIQSFKKSNSYRRTLKNCLKLAQNSPNIKGIRITCSGRFNGVERARLETRSWGQTSLQHLDSHVDYSAKPALTNAGLMGIKVWVSFKDTKK